MSSGRVWYLYVKSFAEIVSYATHYYVELLGPSGGGNDRWEISYIMSDEDAKALSRTDYKEFAGDVTTRFRSREAMLGAVRCVWAVVGGDDLLIDGGSGVRSPQRVIAGSARLDDIYKRAEAACVGPFDAYPREFTEEWKRTLEEEGWDTSPYVSEAKSIPFDNEYIVKFEDDQWRMASRDEVVDRWDNPAYRDKHN